MTNDLNQYLQTVTTTPSTSRQGLRYDKDGNLAETYSTGDSNCDGAVDFFDIDLFCGQLGARGQSGGQIGIRSTMFRVTARLRRS